MSRVRQLPFAVLLVFAACSGNGGSGSHVAAYRSGDPCVPHADETSCAADTANACTWVGLDATCPAGTDCPDGVCVQPDPCRAHADQASCAADDACGWADVDLCPPGGDCPGGFCYSVGVDDCTCVCPLYCPAGEDCPDCECDCAPPGGGGGGGDTCTCVCPDCGPGETCPPCDCACDGGGAGCSDTGTCTCTCPDCPPGADCAPCDCTCEDTPVTGTCECPTCPAGTDCPPCDCDGGEADPCLAYTDEATCTADTANECSWYGLGVPCMDGEPCVSGVCQGPSSGGGTDCTCVCPECAPDQPCPPCTCSGSGGGSTGSGGTGTGTTDPQST